MKRRKFIKAAALSGLATSAMGATVAGNSKPAEDQQFYEFRRYELRWGGSVNTLGKYLESALIPALNRYGVEAVGVFTEMAKSEPPVLYMLIPYVGAAEFAGLSTALLEDKIYQKAAAEYNAIGPNAEVYFRYDTWLLRAFEGMPQVKLPEQEERIFELRTYEGYSEDAVRRKVKMFNEGEIDIFLDTGLHPVFFGHMLAGPDMPALSYMLTFKDMAERDENWQAFIKHPDWQRMSKMEEYANTVSKIHRVFLEPTGYSQV